MAHVRVAHAESNGTYGAPRLVEELRDEGFATSKKRLSRINARIALPIVQ